jgi:hypothetical protein
MLKPALLLVVIGWTAPALAEPVRIPLVIGNNYLLQQTKSNIFTDAGQSARIWDDGSGCNYMVLTRPRSSVAETGLTIASDAEARVGQLIVDQCIVLFRWRGIVEIVERPEVAADGAGILFRVTDSRLRDKHGQRDIPAVIWDWTKRYAHPRFDVLRLELAPALAEVGKLLAQFTAPRDAAAFAELVESMTLGELGVTDEGVSASLTFDAQPSFSAASDGPQPALTQDDELAGLAVLLQHYDAFLTFVVKHAAIVTTDASKRDALLQILLEARYELLDAAMRERSKSPDPVRALFLESWTQLSPLLREISLALPGESALHLVSFIAAADALQAIDRLGPGFGIEISTDALRRLARLMAPDATGDPLRFDESVDPKLRELFEFGDPLPQRQPVAPGHSGSGWLIPRAHAVTGWDDKSLARLNRWLPTRPELPGYLLRIGHLLEDTADDTLRLKPLASEFRQVFTPLVLATAWQESCWRQYVVHKDKRWPIKSQSGAVGIMQVLPRVWRGFYDPHALSWDISYNASAGSEILRHYLVKYAIRNKEHEVTRDVHNLARATYALYNGGPRQLRRYRFEGATPRQRAVDRSFWEKYQAIRRDGAGRVLECYG